jgi:UDP-GlcNAc:undecaprenyl-phosphate/decaprenyl-phosphate GlcNAc-1-phosphate transferase
MIDIKYILLLFLINGLFLIKNDSISNLFQLYDHPDFKRKIHKKKISCIGGFYLFANLVLLISYNFFASNKLIPFEYFQNEITNFYFFLITFLTIFLIGIYDDKYGIEPNKKLILFVSIILFLIMADRDLAINSLRFSFTDNVYNISDYSKFFTILCIIVFMNAFNMYDGSNLQVSSVSIVIMIYLFSLAKTFDYLSLTFIVCLIFFSILNFKNKLFLGDNGSLILSFLISYSLIKFYNMNNIIYADEVCLLLLMPIIDLLRLFVSRISSGKSPFLSDKKHFHHLILERVSYNQAIILLFLMYLLPIIFAIITKKYFLFITMQILIYLISIILLNKNKYTNVK